MNSSRRTLSHRSVEWKAPCHVFQPRTLHRIGAELLVAAGLRLTEARIVMQHCVDANLAGHDSHGIIQIPTYIDRIAAGHIVPGARGRSFRNPRPRPSSMATGASATSPPIAPCATPSRRRRSNVAAATVFRQGHIGRLGSYPLMAVEAGMIGLITADSGRSAKQVTPFGGREPRLGTNPLSIAVPSDLDGPLFLDMATSAVAAGKSRSRSARGESIPLGWVVDRDGRPTTDPNALKRRRRVAAAGRQRGYKGSGLSAIVEILCGLFTGARLRHRSDRPPQRRLLPGRVQSRGVRPLAEFKREVTEFATT